LISVMSCDKFNLLVWGDNGQVDLFFRNSLEYLVKIEVPAIGRIGVKDTVAQAAAELAFLPNVKMTIANGVCTSLQDNLGVEITNANRGMINFRSVACASKEFIKNAHQITILGDLVYVDNKFSRIGAPRAHYTQRLQCGFKLLREMFSNYYGLCGINRTDAVQTKLYNSVTHSFFDELYLLQGNHAFDQNLDLESAGIGDMITASALYMDRNGGTVKRLNVRDSHIAPRLVTPSSSPKVEFLDLNTQMLKLGELALAANGNNAAYVTAVDNLFLNSYPTIDEARQYFEWTFDIFAKFKSDTVWKIIRSHHAVFNLEGPSQELGFFFTRVDARRNLPTSGKTLWQVMIEAGVRVWLGSHHHSSHVMAFPISKQGRLAGCNLAAAPSVPIANGCFPHCNAFTEGYDVNFTNNALGNFYVFVTGSSGRMFDPMEQSDRSRGSLIWGKGGRKDAGDPIPGSIALDHYGGLYLQFDGDTKTMTGTYFTAVGGINATSNVVQATITLNIRNAATETIDTVNTETNGKCPRIRRKRRSIMKKLKK